MFAEPIVWFEGLEYSIIKWTKPKTTLSLGYRSALNYAKVRIYQKNCHLKTLFLACFQGFVTPKLPQEYVLGPISGLLSAVKHISAHDRI